MKILSDGTPSTLKRYKEYAMALTGNNEQSKIVKYLNDKIKESPNGENEEVWADESQMLILITSLL